MATMLISGNTHPGKRRKENQDAFIYRQLWSDDKALLVVIDGVGGYAGGDKAAAIARDCIEQYMQMPRGDTMTMLREALIFANNRIVEERKKDQHHSEMCCVLTAVVADTTRQCLYYVHVGDTRLYRYRNGSLQKFTRDHSFVGIREDAGEITEWEAMSHPHRNQILREVGSALHRLDDEDFMDYGTEDLLPGDQLMLCSDGLTDMITLQQIINLLSTDQPPSNKVTNLIALANEIGGHDNITVLVLQFPAGETTGEDEPDESITDNRIDPLPPVLLPAASTAERSRWLWGVMVILLIAAAGWYFRPARTTTAPVAEPASIDYPPDSISIDMDRLLPGTRSKGPAVHGPLTEQLDTLRISTPKNYEDLKQYADSTGRSIVLIPAKNVSKHFAAVEIDRRSAKAGDTMLIKNLRLRGFETGILVKLPLFLKTENLLFENVRYPFQYPSKTDSQYNAVLFTNSLKQ